MTDRERAIESLHPTSRDQADDWLSILEKRGFVIVDRDELDRLRLAERFAELLSPRDSAWYRSEVFEALDEYRKARKP